MTPEQPPGETQTETGSTPDEKQGITAENHGDGVTLVMPVGLASEYGFEGDDVIQIRPMISTDDPQARKAEVRFELTAVEEDVPFQARSKKANRVKANLPDKSRLTIRFPKEFATSLAVDSDKGGPSTIYEAVGEGKLSVNGQVESPGVTGTAELGFDPAAVTWPMPNDGGREAFRVKPQKEWPVTKTLVKYKAGPRREYGDAGEIRHDAYRLELPREFAHPQVLELDDGRPVATRLSHINGEPTLVLDLRVSDDEMSDSHVRTLFKSGWIKVSGSQYDQYRVLFSKPWAHALGWDGDTDLDIEPGPERIVVAREGVL